MVRIASTTLLLVATLGASLRGETLIVPLPDLVGPYGAAAPLTTSFDAGIPLPEIVDVRLHLVGEIVPGVGIDTMTGAVLPWLAEFLGSFSPPSGLWIASVATSGPFDEEVSFSGFFGATWEFLADGTGELSFGLSPMAGIGLITMTVPPSGTVTSAELVVEFTGGSPLFTRGDCNSDGVIDVADGVFHLTTLFVSGVAPCLDACDANDDGLNDIADPVFLLAGLFAGGSPPPPPFPACGADPTPGGLGCEAFGACP